MKDENLLYLMNNEGVRMIEIIEKLKSLIFSSEEVVVLFNNETEEIFINDKKYDHEDYKNNYKKVHSFFRIDNGEKGYRISKFSFKHKIYLIEREQSENVRIKKIKLKETKNNELLLSEIEEKIRSLEKLKRDIKEEIKEYIQDEKIEKLDENFLKFKAMVNTKEYKDFLEFLKYQEFKKNQFKI